jgi:hypothetical protein
VVALLLLAGLVQDRDRAHAERAGAVGDGQVLDHEVPHDAHRGVGLPRGVVEQTLHLVRGTVPGRLGQGPAVLAGQVAHQPGDVLASLQAGLAAGEHLPDPAQQFLASFGRQLGGLYHQGGGCLVTFLIHSLEGSRDGRPRTRTSRPTRRICSCPARGNPTAGPPTDPATPRRQPGLRSRSAAVVLDNLASALSEAHREQEALEPALEAVEILRLLTAEDRVHAPHLSGALHNLANRVEDLGRTQEALDLSLEILTLEGRTDATAAAIHRLLEVEPSARPPGADDALPAAMERLGDLVPLALWSLDDPADRRALLSAFAWMASAGAVHLALEAHDPKQALAWIDRTTTLDLRTGAALRAPEFAELAQSRPDLAARLRRALGAAEQRGEDADELVGDVIAEIRSSGSGFDRFPVPRPAEEIVAGLPMTTAVLVAGPRGGMILLVTAGEPIAAVPLAISFDDVAELATMSLTSRPVPVSVSHTRLRALVVEHVLPALRDLTRSAAPVLVVPVGVMNWLPVQAVGALTGLTLAISPSLTSSARERTWTSDPLVVHSHGIGRRLDAGLEESKQVAAMLGVEARTDPVDRAEVCRQLGRSPFVHFACHALTDMADPQASGLLLGPRDQDRLTVHALAEYMSAGGAPCFVALSACQTGRTELAIPEHASSIANVFLGHGARCALSTLWNVDDIVTRDFGVEFVRRWHAGLSAGSAYDLALRALAAQREGDPHAFETLDAFQLLGDRSLLWPLTTSPTVPTPTLP